MFCMKLCENVKIDKKKKIGKKFVNNRENIQKPQVH